MRLPFVRRRSSDGFDEEVETHIALETDRLVDRGFSRDEARARALRAFGNVTRVKERHHEMRPGAIFDSIRQDVRYALGSLRHARAFALVAVLTLALGIGATTAIFSLVYAVVLRPLPFPDVDRIVILAEQWKGNAGGDVSAGNLVEFTRRARSFDALAGVQYASFNLAASDAPERVIGARVSAPFFDVFGARPQIGRTFRREEDAPGLEQVVVLSHRLWERRFARDPHVVGRTLRMNNTTYTVVGVMPAWFDVASGTEELWVPMAFTPERRANFDEHYLTAYGRLKSGVPFEAAQAEARAIGQRLQHEQPRHNAERDLLLLDFREQFVGNYATRLFVLLGAVGLVLLISCVNVANLLLARGAARGRELAVRTAIGAGRGRLVRQLLTESAVLAAAGAAAGLVVATWTVRLLQAISPPGVPRIEQAGVNVPVVLFTAGVAVACTLAVGLLPALGAARGDVHGLMRDGTRTLGTHRGGRTRAILIAAEVTFAVLLLAGAGLLVRSSLKLQQVRPGFEPSGLLSARLTLPASSYPEPGRVREAFRRIRDEVAAMPGARQVALVSEAPLGGGGNSNGLIPEGRPLAPESAIDARFRLVTPGYLSAMRTPLLAGRDFDGRDRRGATRVMIVSDAFARMAWPGQDPIGKRVVCCEGSDADPMWKTIVGVAADIRSTSLDQAPRPEFYLPLAQAPDTSWFWIGQTMYIVVRTDRDPSALVPAVRAAMRRVDPDVPLFNVMTMEERLSASLATARFNTLLLTTLGLLGLALAAVGIYGVIAYLVTERTPEIGVRMALGATPRDVVGLVLRQTGLPVAVGGLCGAAAALVASRVLEGQLFEVSPRDPVTLAVVLGLLGLVAVLAASGPALRAARIDPTRALQQ